MITHLVSYYTNARTMCKHKIRRKESKKEISQTPCITVSTIRRERKVRLEYSPTYLPNTLQYVKQVHCKHESRKNKRREVKPISCLGLESVQPRETSKEGKRKKKIKALNK